MRALLLGTVLSTVLLQSCGMKLHWAALTGTDPTFERFFPKAVLPPHPTPYRFTESAAPHPPLLDSLPKWVIAKAKKGPDTTATLAEFLRETETTAFLVLRNDSILYEAYPQPGIGPDSLLLVFSVSKAITSALVGKALAEGYIDSLEQPVTDFLEDFPDDPYGKITLRDLLNMTTGLNHGDFHRFGKLAALFLNRNSRRYLRKHAKLEAEPGTEFDYESAATQILGFCLEKATGKPVWQYQQEVLWRHLRPEHRAAWALDENTSDSIAKFYGGFQASARDLAKFGRLYLNGGRVDGQAVLPQSWVEACVTADTCNGAWCYYNNCFWLYTYQRQLADQDFIADGYKGQVVYMDRATNTIIVRLGLNYGGVRWEMSLSKLAKRLNGIPDLPKVDSARAAPYVGTYISPTGKPVKVSLSREGRLALQGKVHKRMGKNTYPLYPYDVPDAFVLTSRGLRVFFERNSAGVVNGALLEIWGRRIPLEKNRAGTETDVPLGRN